MSVARDQFALERLGGNRYARERILFMCLGSKSQKFIRNIYNQMLEYIKALSQNNNQRRDHARTEVTISLPLESD